MSDANKGLSGRKGRVGAMRGLISLAVIFFIALSAQANAKTFMAYIKCEGKVKHAKANDYKTPPVEKGDVTFYFGYTQPDDSLYKNYKLFHDLSMQSSYFEDGLDCLPMEVKLYEESISFECPELSKDGPAISMTINRITGTFGYSSSRPLERGIRILGGGSCQKVEKKF